MNDKNHNMVTDQLDAFWMPFTAFGRFQEAPRFMVRARDMYYEDSNGNRVLDGFGKALWIFPDRRERFGIMAIIHAGARGEKPLKTPEPLIDVRSAC